MKSSMSCLQIMLKIYFNLTPFVLAGIKVVTTAVYCMHLIDTVIAPTHIVRQT